MHHVIIKSEAAVRSENDRMKREIETLRADNARLREMVGEPQLEVISHVAANHGDIAQFTAGECKVTIVRPPGPPSMNPMAAAAKAQVAARPAAKVAARVPAAAAAQQQQPQAITPVARATSQEELDELAENSRFALLELR